MNPGSRFERDPMSGAQQTSDESGGPGTGGQWDNPASTGQGKWENRQGKSARIFCGLSLPFVHRTSRTGF